MPQQTTIRKGNNELLSHIYEFRWGSQSVTTFAACVKYNKNQTKKQFQQYSQLAILKMLSAAFPLTAFWNWIIIVAA